MARNLIKMSYKEITKQSYQVLAQEYAKKKLQILAFRKTFWYRKVREGMKVR